jgi:hypothetical protein
MQHASAVVPYGMGAKPAAVRCDAETAMHMARMTRPRMLDAAPAAVAQLYVGVVVVSMVAPVTVLCLLIE